MRSFRACHPTDKSVCVCVCVCVCVYVEAFLTTLIKRKKRECAGSAGRCETEGNTKRSRRSVGNHDGVFGCGKNFAHWSFQFIA